MGAWALTAAPCRGQKKTLAGPKPGGGGQAGLRFATANARDVRMIAHVPLRRTTTFLPVPPRGPRQFLHKCESPDVTDILWTLPKEPGREGHLRP